MRAMLWRDWLLLRRNPLYLALTVGWWLFTPIATGVLAAGSTPQETAAVNAWDLTWTLAPWHGWAATILTCCTLVANATTMDFNAAPQSDGTVENWRGSGRPMIVYCVAKSLLPVLLAEFISLSNLGYLLWAGLGASTTIAQAVCVVVAPAAVAFAAEQLFLASHAASMGSLTVLSLLASVPAVALMVMSLAVPATWALVALIAFGVGAAVAVVLSAHRRCPDVLRPIVPRSIAG